MHSYRGYLLRLSESLRMSWRDVEFNIHCERNSLADTPTAIEILAKETKSRKGGRNATSTTLKREKRENPSAPFQGSYLKVAYLRLIGHWFIGNKEATLISRLTSHCVTIKSIPLISNLLYRGKRGFVSWEFNYKSGSYILFQEKIV